MNNEQLEALNWKEDEEYQAAQTRLGLLIERSQTNERQRGELKERIAGMEREMSVMQGKQVLGEISEKDMKTFTGKLNRFREEVRLLEEEAQGIHYAQQRLNESVQEAERAAKLKVAEHLGPIYQQAVIDLKHALEKAAELNNVLHAVHRHYIKSNLRTGLNGHPLLKVMDRAAAWNWLSGGDGRPSMELSLWQKHVAGIIEA